MEIKIYSKNEHLIIEDFNIREKINYQFIESVLICYVGETYPNELCFYLQKPIVYENLKTSWWGNLVFKLFLKTHADKYKIEKSMTNENLMFIIKEINENLPNVFIPQDIEKSMFWKTTDKNYIIPSLKLIYSKLNLGLTDTLIKYNKLKNIS